MSFTNTLGWIWLLGMITVLSFFVKDMSLNILIYNCAVLLAGAILVTKKP